MTSFEASRLIRKAQRLFADWPGRPRNLAVRYGEFFFRSRTPLATAVISRDRKVDPKRLGRAISPQRSRDPALLSKRQNELILKFRDWEGMIGKRSEKLRR
jgi:hypothetical protein